MAKKFLTDINIAGGVFDSSGDIGNSGQVLSSTGSGVNWINGTTSASIIYQDGFTGNGSTTAFTLANSIDSENKTQVYIDGVYQHKDTFSLSGTTLTFSTAPPNTTDIEVISFSSVSAADDILYDNDFGSAGLMTTDGSGTYSITTNNSSNWNTAYTHSQAAHAPASAEQNVQSDWTASSGDTFIQNKPTIPSGNQIIDWTADQGSTEIHSGNYIDTTYTVGDGGLTQVNFTTADNTKLDGIEASATIDQTDAEIRTAVEAATDSNVFTDADHTKLDAIEASADITDTTNVTAAGALMDSEVTNLADVKAFDTTDYATAAQGTLAASAQQPPSEGAFANGDKTKLDGIAAGAEVNVQSDWISTSGDNLILNKPSIPSITGLATETYVDTAVSDLVDSSPATLNTLNELAAALGDDPNFATTTATSIGTKLPLAGGTISGQLESSYTGTGSSLQMYGHAGAANYNYFLNASNDGGVKAVHFVNGSTRTADGGVNAYVIRNDGGKLILGTATQATEILGSGGGSANWNTAYGWGDHASGGYAADNAVVKLTGNQSIGGIKTFTGTNVTLDTAVNSWKYIRLQSAGTVKWDIATNESNDSSSLQFRPAGGSTNRVTISQAGVVTAPGGSSTNWNTAHGWGDHGSGGYAADSAVVKLTGTQSISGDKSFTSLSNYYSGHLYYTPYNAAGAHYPHFLDGSNGTGVVINWRLYTGASTVLTHVWDITKTRFVNRVESSIDMRAPIYYDINDTTYYADLGATSNNSTSVSLKVRQTQVIGDSSTYNQNDGSWGARLIVSDNVHARIDVAQDANAVRSSWFTHTGHLHSTFGTVTAHHQYLNSHNANRQILYNGYSEEQASYRAPTFYDSNDTSYYTDPNSTSNINALTANTLMVGSTSIGLVVTPSGWTSADVDQWPYLYWHRDTANNWDEGLIKNSSSRGFFGKPGWGIHMSSTKAFHVFSSGWTSNFGVEHGGSCRAAGDLRAPLFYDLNNTGYYTDPASESKIFKLWINNGGAGGVGWSTGFNQGSGSNYWNQIQDAGVARQRNFGTGGYDWYSSGGTQLMDLSNGGTLFAAADMRSPIFYDSADTGYYVDPAVGSILKGVQINTSVSSAGSQLQIYTTSAHQYPQVYSNGGYEAMWNYRNNVAQWYVGIRTSSQLLGNTGFHFYNTTSSQTVGGWSIDGHSYSIASSRAPLFYDSNNTGKYLDPATGSAIVNLTVAPRVSSGTEQVMTINHGSGSHTGVGLGIASANSGHAFNLTGSVGNGYARITSAYNANPSIYASGDIRTPIYYDLNNTAYYLDPASTTRLSSLRVAGGNVIIGTETSTACTLKVSSTKNGAANNPHFCITGNGYTALHWLDTTAYFIVTNSASRDIRISANSNGVKLTPGATAWVSNSDIALKENLKPLENVLDKIKDYRCVEYNLKNSAEDKKIGFIAQDWVDDFPAIVNKDEKDMLGMKYTETIPVLLKAIQELEARIKELENK